MKKNIAIIYGGYSGEYDISRQSGENIANSLDKEKYEVYPILISKEKWAYSQDENEYLIDKNDFSLIIEDQRIHFAAVFNMIHGTPGEDGRMQGYFDMLDIAYTSSGQAVSSLTSNKNYCKGFVDTLNVKVAKSEFLLRSKKDNYQRIIQNLSLPVFVKPNNGGSSVAMTKVKHWNDLEKAVETAFKEDEEVLVEEFIEGREITCAAYFVQGKLSLLPITEIVSKKEFFDFEAKYDPNLVDEIVPAPIPKAVWKECEETTAFLYDELQCSGLVRIDYIFNDKGLYFLEVNTIPGMTPSSIVPKMIEEAGMSTRQLVNLLLEECLS